MEQSLLSRVFGKIAMAILAIALVDLVYLNYWVFQNDNLKSKIEGLEQTRTIEPQDISATQSAQTTATPLPEAQSSPQVTREVETKTVVEKETQTIVQTAQKEIFVPMGSGSTKSNSFADLAGVEVTIDTSKYSAIEQVVFEASLWVEGGNGKAWAQVKNVDDNTGLIESQIASVSGSGEVKTSGKIPFPGGKKTYRAQAKTDLVNFATHVDNARLKITLR